MYPKTLILSAATTALLALEQLPFAFGYTRLDESPLSITSKIVQTFDNESFGAVLNDTQNVWLVNFHSSWCPDCRQFALEWEKVSSVYSNVENIHWGAVDCTTQNDICSQEGIQSYPRVKMYHVPPDAKEAITMPFGRDMNARYVAKWIEETLKDNKMQRGIDVDEVYPPNNVSRNPKKMFGDPVEPLYDDRSVDVQLKRLKAAGTTALFTFEVGFFMGTTVLQGKRYEAAVTWVRTLAASFPFKENRDAFAKLVDAMKEQKRWKQADWNNLINRWKVTANAMSYPSNLFADKDVLYMCKTFMCGFWTLFHTLTVSDVTSESSMEQWKPSEIVLAIRLVVQYFFGCEMFKRRFLTVNTKTVIENLALIDEDGPNTVILWIWTVHNIVNMFYGKSMWPTKLSCPYCYDTNILPLSFDPTMLNEDIVAAYVRSVYKFGDKLKLEQHRLVTTPWVSMRSIATVAVLIAIFAALIQQFKHHLIGTKVLKTQDHIA
ncbi:unnamed protein product [Peronospora farinosa]|uniref:Sulfhydryl oxidase n=1 Tax=Peronospora farinosa TaxID=134698 RepID=A0AAV0SUN9_9STRA|nr:unnamed protein product [Peronospora farinosa]CAI5708539.1 unnamed protein product [Peronospora farinosa]